MAQVVVRHMVPNAGWEDPGAKGAKIAILCPKYFTKSTRYTDSKEGAFAAGAGPPYTGCRQLAR